MTLPGVLPALKKKIVARSLDPTGSKAITVERQILVSDMLYNTGPARRLVLHQLVVPLAF
jgi:hypothetical protein